MYPAFQLFDTNFDRCYKALMALKEKVILPMVKTVIGEK